VRDELILHHSNQTGKLTVPGKHLLEWFQKGLVTLPLVPERYPVKRGGTAVIDEAHVSWDMPWILQGLPTPPGVWNSGSSRV
jgi:hypothetical protein